MKKILIPISALLLLACTSCEEKIDVDKEKAAIMAVIQSESEFARDGNVEGLKSLYMQDEYNTRLIIGNENYKILTGWDKVGPILDQALENTETEFSATITKDNPIIKVNEETAWIICDNTWEGIYEGEDFIMNNIQVTFLEKVEGEWKISFISFIDKPKPEDVEEIE